VRVCDLCVVWEAGFGASLVDGYATDGSQKRGWSGDKEANARRVVQRGRAHRRGRPWAPGALEVLQAADKTRVGLDARAALAHEGERGIVRHAALADEVRDYDRRGAGDALEKAPG
jgi:hypothetical protein